MELFIHTHGNEHPEIIEVEASALVRTLLVEGEPGGHIWIEEVDEDVDIAITIKEAGIHHHHHVHRGHCRRVEVVVRFNGDYKRTYGPATTIKTVSKWAFGPDGAKLSEEQAATHVLAQPGADHFLEDGVHIGSLVTSDSCTVTLDLLPRARFAG